MTPHTLLLGFLLVGLLGLFSIQRRRLRLILAILAFLLKVLVSEVQKCGTRSWKRLLWAQGSIPISDLKLCQKILTHPAWPDRVKAYSVIHSASFGKPIGLIYGCGEAHERARRASSKILNQIGFHNTSKLEQFVTPQADLLLTTLRNHVILSRPKDGSHDGALWCPRQKLNRFATNVVWTIIFGQKLPRDDATIETFLNRIDSANQKFRVGKSACSGLQNLISRLLDPCLRIWMWYIFSRDIFRAINELIHKRCESLQAAQGPTNFLDAYLLNLERTKTVEMTNEELLVVLRDLLIGTSETVGSSLEFAILHVALNPSVQERLQVEIDRVVGRSRRPLYSDRSSLPYTQATILEILRHGSVISPGERVAVKDNVIDGSFYPKGTVVGIRLHEIHHSKDLWHDPEAFRPERFLSSDGIRVENKGKIIPFGYGRRLCIGESLAQVALFMFVTALVQEFSLQIPKELPPPSQETLRGQARSPVPYFVRVIPRAGNNRK